MNEFEFEQMARKAATAVRTEAARVADSRSALSSVLVEGHQPTERQHLEEQPPTALEGTHAERRSRWVPMLAAAASIAAVVGGVLVIRGGDDQTVVMTEPTNEPSPAAPPATPEPSDEAVTPAAPSTDQPATTPATMPPGAAPVPLDEPIPVPDQPGPPLTRTVLATVGDGDGLGELGYEDCRECEPLHPWAPVVTEDGTIILADALNERWQMFDGVTWIERRYPAGGVVTGTPVIGPNGVLYALVADGLPQIEMRRVAAYDPSTLDELGWFPAGATAAMYTSIDLVADVMWVGPAEIRRFDLPLGRATTVIDHDSNEVTLSLSGVQRTFEFPATWFLDRGSASLDDGSAVLRVLALDEDGTGDWMLVRLFADGTVSSGLIGPRSNANNGYGSFTATGYVQLEDAIVEYAFPEFAGPDPLAGWVVPDFAAPDLDDLPRLLPQQLTADAGSTVRFEYTGSQASRVAHAQTWVRADDGNAVDALVQITTKFDPDLIGNAVDDDVDVTGWAKAYFTATGEVDTLRLHSATRTMVVWTTGLERDDVVVLARSLTVDADGVGWATPDLPASDRWTMVSEGWDAGRAERTLVQRAADGGMTFEMRIVTGGPTEILTPWFFGAEIDLGDPAGRPALLFRGGVSGMTWSPRDGVVVVLGSTGPPDELFDVARSVTEVDQATWDTASTPDLSNRDGCQSLFC